jgi:hypothetical protein
MLADCREGQETIFVIGYPSDFGGADTELWHTVRLWRQHGVPVTLIPTWRPDARQQQRLEQIGATTHVVESAQQLDAVPGLREGIVVSFCNGEFLQHAEVFTRLRCRTVWVNCMTWAFPAELKHYEHHGTFSAYVFQSHYQRQQLSEVYRQHGAMDSQFHVIRGAFSPDEFPFAPTSHQPSEPFVLGRIARHDPDKWSSNLWPIYDAVRYGNKKARVMAWSDRLTRKCGEPPDWAEALAANVEPAQKFLSSLHCLFPINGGARENWPRVGLEAMSAGVPIVTQKQWGWCEMIEHGVTGFLGEDDYELAHYAAMLAYDEELRLQIALNARRRLVDSLASPELIWDGWSRLFCSLGDEAQARQLHVA